jgi:SAM-dependent methyltransferase
MNIFDRRLVRLHRDRAAPGLAAHDFLFREVAERLADRLDDVARKFPVALDLGCHGGEIARALRGRGGIATLVQSDLSPAMAQRAATTGFPVLTADEELLPFAPHSFDLVISNLSLHWVNDLPGCLVQVRECLKPDGLLLAAMLGGDTLTELRRALMEAELAETGGASPRISPFADLRDIGSLLQRAGFALPVVDSDRLTVSYPDAFKLMHDLRGMGEANAVRARSARFARRAVFAHASALYRQHYGNVENRLPVSIQIIYLTAWTQHVAQQQPLAAGAARSRLADALGAIEHSAGEKARPR